MVGIISCDPNKASLHHNHIKDVLKDTTNILDCLGLTITQLESVVNIHDKPNFSCKVLHATRLAYNHFLGYLTMQELTLQGIEKSTEVEVDTIKHDLEESIKDRQKEDLLNNQNVWVVYSHVYATSGHGRINTDTIAHQKFCVDPIDNFPADCPADDNEMDSEVLEALAHFSNQESDGNRTWEEDNSDYKDDQEDMLDSSNSHLDKEDCVIAGGIPPPPPDACPVALNSIRSRFDHVLCQLQLFQVNVETEVQRSIIRIICHLARDKRFYPMRHFAKSGLMMKQC